MLRFFSLNVFIGVHTLIMACWGALISIFDRNGRIVHTVCSVPWAKLILWVSGVKVELKGSENVNRDVPRIYMVNHQSIYDIFALLAHLPVHFKFILKRELMKIPLLGYAMKKAGYISINRENPREALKSMNEAAGKIRDGASVIIFPEGTRSVNGKLQSFKKGGFHLALKSGCDLVPVTIVNSYRIVPKGSFRINKGSFSMNIGTPIPVKGVRKKNMDKLMAQVREAMLEHVNGE